MSHEDLKQAVKEAAKEWMDEQFARIGRWTFGGFAALIFAGMVYWATHVGK